MKRYSRFLSLTTALLGLGFLSVPSIETPLFASKDDSKKSDGSKKKNDVVVAKVNGTDIYLADVKKLEKALPKQIIQAAKDKSKLFEAVRSQLIDIKLVTENAKKSGIEKSAEVKAAIDQATEQVIIQAFLAGEMKKFLTEKAVKEAYDQYVAEFPKDKTEIKARHILVKDEASAKKIIKSLESGGDFMKLARENSIDKTSAAEGGDVGYFTDETMVPEFYGASEKLKSGEFTKSPVKSDFGYHIIKVDDKHKAKPKPFDQMKDELAGKVAEKGMLSLVKNLREKADIQTFDSNGKPEAKKEDKTDSKDAPSDTSKADSKDAASDTSKADESADKSSEKKDDKK
jgi:peptidyl-prolyl cis-trans isomerase C